MATKDISGDDKKKEIKEVFETEPWPYGKYERTRFHPFNYPGPGMLMYLSPPIEPCTFKSELGVEKEFKVENFSSDLFGTKIRKKDLKSSKQKYGIIKESDILEYQTHWKYSVYKRENNLIIGSLRSTKTEDREEHLILRARNGFNTKCKKNNKSRKKKKSKNLNCRIHNDININIINQDQEERNVDHFLTELFRTEKLYPVVFYLSGSNINPVKMTINLKMCFTSKVFFKVICHDLMNYTNQNFGDVFVVSKKISSESQLCLAVHYNRMFLSLYIFAREDLSEISKYFIEIGEIILEPNFLKYQSSFNFKNMPIAIEAVGFENVISEITKASEGIVDTTHCNNSDPNVQNAFYQNEEDSYNRNVHVHVPRGQPFYCEPRGQPFYSEPRGQPFYSEPRGQPFYSEPRGRPAYCGPPRGQPAYCGPPRGQPAYCGPRWQPAYCGPRGQPAYCGPRGQPAYCGPRLQPAYCEPRGQPAYCEPCGQPDYCEPCGQPDYCEPCGQPDYCEPCEQPDYCEPCGQPDYCEPCVQPSYINTEHPVCINSWNPALMNCVPRFYINSVPPAHINGVPPARINGVPPARINGVPPARINGVPPARINGVPPARINGVPPARINGVPPARINVVPPAHINGVPPAHINGVPPAHINGVPPAHINCVPRFYMSSVPPAPVNGLYQ